MCQENGRTINEGEGGLKDGREEHLVREWIHQADAGCGSLLGESLEGFKAEIASSNLCYKKQRLADLWSELLASRKWIRDSGQIDVLNWRNWAIFSRTLLFKNRGKRVTHTFPWPPSLFWTRTSAGLATQSAFQQPSPAKDPIGAYLLFFLVVWHNQGVPYFSLWIFQWKLLIILFPSFSFNYGI